ncbi:hypothetical protein [Oxalobacter paraformigenes]|uniref:hypothetical protein n=1 Tax=Oxalobacter paraformigenes TaxID=556268 RepID=UPI0005942570|nr:hypothetical protein [Oxalobacter paraformigenes]
MAPVEKRQESRDFQTLKGLKNTSRTRQRMEKTAGSPGWTEIGMKGSLRERRVLCLPSVRVLSPPRNDTGMGAVSGHSALAKPFRDVGMSGCRDVGMSGCRDVGMSGCRDVGMSGCRDVGMSGFRDFGISGFRDFGISGFRDFGISGFRDFGISGFRDLRI